MYIPAQSVLAWEILEVVSYIAKKVIEIKLIDTNPKRFWRYVNSRLKICSTIDDLLSLDDHSVHIDIAKAKLFSQLLHLYLLREIFLIYQNLILILYFH